MNLDQSQSVISEVLQACIDFLISRGHSKERAEQIAGNHFDVVRAEMEKANAEKTKEETAPGEASAPESPAE